MIMVSTQPRRLYEPSSPSAVPISAVQSAWVIPSDWITVREFAVSTGRSTTDVPRLGQHGKAAMAVLRSAGVTTMPQRHEQADNGQSYWVNVYPAQLLIQTQWQVWK
jgi:hypothetical protein